MSEFIDTKIIIADNFDQSMADYSLPFWDRIKISDSIYAALFKGTCITALLQPQFRVTLQLLKPNLSC